MHDQLLGYHLFLLLVFLLGFQVLLAVQNIVDPLLNIGALLVWARFHVKSSKVEYNEVKRTLEVTNNNILGSAHIPHNESTMAGVKTQ